MAESRKRGLKAPYWYSQLLYSNLLASSIFIETLASQGKVVLLQFSLHFQLSSWQSHRKIRKRWGIGQRWVYPLPLWSPASAGNLFFSIKLVQFFNNYAGYWIFFLFFFLRSTGYLSGILLFWHLLRKLFVFFSRL